jgi:hypothetical protein
MLTSGRRRGAVEAPKTALAIDAHHGSLTLGALGLAEDHFLTGLVPVAPDRIHAGGRIGGVARGLTRLRTGHRGDEALDQAAPETTGIFLWFAALGTAATLPRRVAHLPPRGRKLPSADYRRLAAEVA